MLDSTSPRNEVEACLIVEILCRLIRDHQFSLSDISVAVPYRSMSDVLTTLVKMYLAKEFPTLDIDQLLHTTIDGIRGHERRIMIISLVVTKYPGFVNESRRLNTALSRAKDAMIVLGNEPELKQLFVDGLGPIKNVLDFFRHQNLMCTITHTTPGSVLAQLPSRHPHYRAQA